MTIQKCDAKEYIPGLGDYFYIDPTHVSSVGGAEEFMPGLGTNFLIAENDLNSIGGADKYIPGLGDKFFILPAHIRWNNTVVFTILDDTDTPVENAKVYMNGTDDLTDSSGNVTFTDVPSDTRQSVTVELDGYKLLVTTIEVPNTDASVESTLNIQKYFEITFHVTDGEAVIEGASVTFNDETIETNSSGNAVFSTALYGADQAYTVTADYFEDGDGTKTVTVDATVNVTLEGEAVTFTVKDEDAVAVEGATVTFNEEEKETDEDGIAVFRLVSMGVGQAYTVTKTGYKDIDTTVTVTGTTAVAVELQNYSTITFHVTHEASNISGASIVFNGETKTTDAGGLVSFTEVLRATDKPYTVTKSGYTVIEDVTTVTTDDTIDVSLVDQVTITFHITSGGTHVAGMDVTFNGDTITTNASGLAVFSGVDIGNNQAYSLEKTGFTTIYGTTNVTTTAIVNETATVAITFHVTDLGGNVEAANVTFHGETIATNASGLAIFAGVELGADQAYSVAKTLYTTINDTYTVTVGATKEVTIVLA